MFCITSDKDCLSLPLLHPEYITSTMSVTLLQQTNVCMIDPGLESNDAVLAQQYEKLRASLLNMCPAHLWHMDSYRAGCPMPILISRSHEQQLETLHEALTIAINDIVARWWSDLGARFPERMPLEKEEEELLKVGTSLENASKLTAL